MRYIPLLLTLAATAQAQMPSPAFEVATIKPNLSGPGSSTYPYMLNGTLVGKNTSLMDMLRAAWDLSAERVFGPNWLADNRFDLAGKAPAGVPDSAFMPMMQTLLKERFHIEAHLEKREMPVYELTVAKDGIKMPPFDPARQVKQPQNRGGSLIIAPGITMAQLANRLTGATGRPIIDHTGIEGRYTVLLTYLPLGATVPPAMEADAPPDIFAAIQQQLGLKLEPKKEAIDVLVVDHADRVPEGN